MTDDGHDRFEATFVVDVDPATAWERFTRTDDGRWWLPGFEASGVELEAVPPQRLVVRKDTEPCIGTEVVVVLEHEGTGTRVTVVQSGFGAMFDQALDWLAIGWTHIVADLALWLERGIRGGRHLRPWAQLGATFTATPGGLEVGDVAAGGWAARRGLAPGDVLVALGGAPIVDVRELCAVTRAIGPDDPLPATWVRGTQLLDSSSDR